MNSPQNSQFNSPSGVSTLITKITTRVQAKPQLSKQQWKLREFVQVGPESFEGTGNVPLQLLHFEASGKEAFADRADTFGKSIWFLAGFRGANRNDSHILNLVQRAVSNQTFENKVDVYLTPLANPSSRSRDPHQNHQGIDLNSAFLDGHAHGNCVEVRSLKRWLQQIQPKCVITLSNGPSMIRHLNTPVEVVQKLSEISEIPNFVFGTEPEEVNEDGTKVPRETVEESFGSHCVANGVTWIDFSIDKGKKNFEDLKNLDWKPAIGPALKWIVEGFRFDPPKEEPKPILPEVIPVLEIPPELVNF